MKALRWLTAALLITASLGQLNRLFIGDDSDVVIYANDIVIGGLAAWYLAHALIARKSWRIPPVMLWLIGWAVWAGVSLVAAKLHLSGSEWLISASYLIRYVAYVLVLFWVAYDSVVYSRSQSDRRQMTTWWLVVLLVSGLLMAIGGFIQLFILPDLSVLARYGWDPHLDRLVTAMLDPNYAGCYFSILVAVGASLFLHLKEHYVVRTGLLVGVSILLLALLLTYSRSGYLMLAVSFGIITLVRSRSLLIVGIIVAILAVLLVPRIQTRLLGALQIDASAQPRIISWQNSLDIAARNPGLGVGFNSYRYAQDRYGILSLEESGNAGAGADSSWLFVLATTGIPGLLLFGANYAGLIWLSVRMYRRYKDELEASLALGLTASLLGLAVAAQFNNVLFYTWIMLPLWVLAGLTLGLSYEGSDD